MDRSAKRQKLDHSTEPDLEPRSDTAYGFLPRSGQQPNHFDGQGIQNAGHLAAARDINITHHSHARDVGRQDHERREERRRALLESLRFAQMDARRVSIKKAHGKTCRWFLKDPEYLQWSNNRGTHNPGGFLWIKGKPGAGKSTLMKLLLTQTRRTQSKTTLHFFFNARGDELEKTTFGLYRSLLVQLLELHTGLQSIMDRFSDNYHRWSIDLLQELIEEVVEGLGESPLIIFIDALDECEEQEVRGMIAHLSALCDAGNRLHICFASRHYPHITINKGRNIILESREEHGQDIASYIDNVLHVGTGEIVDEIKSDLQEKSSGVFMWVVLVVDILNREWDAGRKHGLRTRLRQIPGDLHTLFRDILTRDSKNTPGLLLCIQWVLFARQPLTPKQLYFAIVSGLEPESLAACHTEDITDDDIAKYILNNSKGLAESTRSKLPTIQFIHESVRDFLWKEKGLQTIWPDAGSNVKGKSHEALKQACLTYLNSEPVAHLNIPVDMLKASSLDATKAREDADSKLPFLEYANQGLLYHADMAQSDGYSQARFLTSFPLAQWVLRHNLFERHRIRRYTPTVSLHYVLAGGNLGALIRAQPLAHSWFQVENQRYGTPLFAALATKSTNAVQALIETEQLGEEANPYLENDPIQTSDYEDWCGAFSGKFSFDRKRGVMSHLAEVGDEKLLKVLCTSEHFDAISPDKNSLTPLFYAMERNHVGVATFLIEQGAEVNYYFPGDMSLLLRAVVRGNIDMIRLLIERDANVSLDESDTLLLANAVTHGNIDMAELLIKRGRFSINTNTQGGRTCLHIASARGYIGIVKLLVDQGADINTVSEDGLTSLTLASTGGYIDTVKFLVERGADVNKRGYVQGRGFGEAPLSSAYTRGHVDVVKFLVDQGAARW
ncbi:hypothetical protein PG987_014387 [Apiospora arundinis]